MHRVDEAERLHAALSAASERLAKVLEDSRFERRDGYALTVMPPFPLPSFNGVWVETDVAAPELEHAQRQIEELGLPFGVTVRAAKTPAAEEAARALGLTEELRMPAMVLTPDELRKPSRGEVQVIRVETADGLAQALAVAAAGFEIPADLLAAVYMVEVSELPGLEYYLARVDGRDVSTAVGFTIDGTVGIFNVGTPPEHRGHGYGASVTASAVADGFAAGADLAWLQSSSMGESVYRRLGFREVETYVLFYRPA